jgi:ATP-dependent phosphoenolpyruvate carboxykinase
MLIRASDEELNREFSKEIHFTIMNAGEFYADPNTENVSSPTSVAVNFK